MQKSLDILHKAVLDWQQSDRAVAQAPSAKQLEKILDVSLSEHAADWSVLEQALKDYLHYNPDVSQAEFYKLLYSGRNQEALLGDWITSLSNATLHTYQVSPVATLMELELIKQWNQLISFDKGDGVMLSGGSQANLIGMMLARYRACPTIKTKGYPEQRLVGFVSDQAHYSYQRAANVLGIGSANLIKVKTDDQGSICPQALELAINKSLEEGHRPFFIGLTAGTTVIGAFDNIQACALLANQYNCWLHVDAAWGAPVLFSKQHKYLLEHSYLADSFVWDAHKLMNVPLTAAAILVKEAGMLEACCAEGGDDYLFHEDENSDYNLGQRSIQCGRRADALKVWLSWKAIGHQGFSDKVNQLQEQAQEAKIQIQNADNLVILAPVNYLNILFRYQPAGLIDEAKLRELCIDICKEMMSTAGPYVDYAHYKGKTGIRLVLANPDVKPEHIKKLIENIQQLGQSLTNI